MFSLAYAVQPGLLDSPSRRRSARTGSRLRCAPLTLAQSGSPKPTRARAGTPASFVPEPWPSVGLPCEEASVPPPSWYTQSEFAELEEQKVFRRHWIYAGPKDKLREPGDYFTGVRDGLGYVVVLDENRKVRAYHNVCSHRAAAVAVGEGRMSVCDTSAAGISALRFECPYHGWQFDTEGRFRGCKVSNGLAGIRNFTPDTSQLHPIPVDTWGPLVFLNWGEEQLPPLEEVLGAGGKQLEAEGLKSDDWVFYKRVDHPMACNWKCMVDNYQDGNYHVYLCHPGLIGCFDMDSSHNKLYDMVSSMWGPNQPLDKWPEDGKPGGKHAHIMESRTAGGVDQSYSMIYPNIFFNRYGKWMSLTNVTPVTQDTCLTTFDLFFKKEDLTDAEWLLKCETAEFELQQEDIELCLRVHANLKNPLYDSGRYAPIEAPMWWWHQLLHKDIFGSAPGLKFKPAGENRMFVSEHVRGQ